MTHDSQPMSPPAQRRSPRWLLAVLVCFSMAILLSLGTWQVKRLHWKEQLLADMEQRRHAAPVPIAAIEAEVAAGTEAEYRPVTVSGVFDHTRERHFFATHHGASGYYIYTPLMLDDGRVLFVNRGFVPFAMKEAATRMQGQIAGRVTVEGLYRARLSEKPSSIVPENDLAKNIFYWKDIEAMTTSAGLDAQRVLPFFVDAGPAPNPGGWPQGGVTLFDLPNNHLQYAITWYGLAAALAMVAGFAYFRGNKPASERSQEQE